ncbi:hypothetical protein ACIBIZ_22575 [Nonomuraea spiralis]|uniref:hypothetical protein n=1 Tax=Nonomuraea TaxID=83681 RepID=UPI000F7A14F3|nr:hypothetical protein [Nonomuraea sp. WAC 01424]
MGPWSVVRWLRAASFAGTCAALAALGHVAGGGCFDPKALLAGFLLVLAPALALTGRERTLAAIVPATGASQVVLHVLLSVGGDHPEPPPAAELGHLHDAGAPGLGMLLVHAASVLLTSVWLRWVESGLCALVRELAGWVLRPLLVLFLAVAGFAAPPRAPVAGREDVTARVRLFLRHVLVLRGPPTGGPEPRWPVRTTVVGPLA